MLYDHDIKIRMAAFDWLTEQIKVYGDVLPRTVLAEGFEFEGIRVPLLGPQGIFKPRVLNDAPLSITTSPNSPYNDSFGVDGLLRYRYRGEDPNHQDNCGLRNAMQKRLPLIYFHGTVPGRYLATWPVFIVNDNPGGLYFSVAVDDADYIGNTMTVSNNISVVNDDGETARREYITSTVRVRLHQRTFRERVLDAYQHQCAFCRLRHEELLDAAHIIADKDPGGEPVVTNGIALCNLHHTAFDKYFIALRPDYILEVRQDILNENDGPTLKHAIQALHGTHIKLPVRASLQPDIALLQQRYDDYLKNRKCS